MTIQRWCRVCREITEWKDKTALLKQTGPAYVVRTSSCSSCGRSISA